MSNLEYQKIGNGFLIDNNFYFTPDEIKKDKLNLLMQRGEDINFGRNDFFKIDYPGEYDNNGIFFKVFDDKIGRLNYFIKYNDINIAIIQSTEIIETHDFEEINYWFFLNPEIQILLEKLEFEGQKILLK